MRGFLMSYCKKFIQGIKQINFAEDSALAVRRVLLASAHQSLETESKVLRDKIASLPKEISDNSSADAQLQAYRQKLQMDSEAILEQQLALVAEASHDGVDLTQPITIDDNFVANFADNFRNVHHLADTLFDAPPIIKQLQTKLYVEILFKLDKVEQEHQYQTLSTHNVQDMLTQAVAAYDSSDNEQLRSECQRLVQMGMFELIQRDCEKVASTSGQTPDYQQYKVFLAALSTRLPEVGQSTIIDNLSQYQNTAGFSIADLLSETEKKLNISEDNDWTQDSKIQAMQQSRALFHQLRFGQEDRREYISKRQENLARDLFWARNIRDIELFTKSHHSDEQFSALVEQRYLIDDHFFKMGVIATKTPGPAQKLEQALNEVIKSRKANPIFPTGDRYHVLNQDDKKKAIALITDKLLEESKKPVISIDKNGEITIQFACFETAKMKVDDILDIILRKGGFGLNADTMVSEIIKDADAVNNMHSLTLTGHSLAEIGTKLDELKLPAEQRSVYQGALKAVKDTVHASQSPEISKLNLNNSQELVLRKLLELQLYFQHVPPVPKAFVSVFKKIIKGDYIGALKEEKLDATIDRAYADLAEIDEATVAKDLQPIISKAKMIRSSTIERKEKLEALENAFKLEVTAEERVRLIAHIFLTEYRDMAATLGLSAEDDARMEHDIGLMSQDLVRLVERTKAGDPVLDKAEQEAYFSAIQQIAAALQPLTLNDTQFKIPHTITGKQTIKIKAKDGSEREIQIQLNTALPYSLIKPQAMGSLFFLMVVLEV